MLSNYQRKLLRKCKLNVYTEFGDSDRKLIDEFIDQGLVKNDIGIVQITEKGRSELENHFRESLWHWIPIVISCIAIILSVISLQRTL